MQESYISLDPEQADSMSQQQRKIVWNQRFQESMGGRAGEILASQFGMTAMVCSYTVLRSRGFRVTPFGLRTLPIITGVLGTGMGGAAVGYAYAKASLGSSEQQSYLLMNKAAILNGSASMDRTAQ